MTTQKEITIMFFDADRGWVTDTIEVQTEDEEEKETTRTDETRAAAYAYYM